MSAEIQTSLFLLTAEFAAVTGVAALVAAGVAWVRGRARLKAAQALRDAAGRLSGEGEVVHKERELLGEFARAYLTQDADVLAGLPARLLALRQMYENVQVSQGVADIQLATSLEEEHAALRAREEALQSQLAATSQQLGSALSTVNALVQEYGRGQGKVITPTAEALLQAILSMDQRQASADTALVMPMAEAEGDNDGQAGEPVVVQGESGGGKESDDWLETGMAASGPAPEGADLVEDVGASTRLEPVVDSAVAPASSLAGAMNESLDLSVPEVEPEPQAGKVKDELDELDIDVLLDAELGKQAQLLQPPPGESEDLDLSRADEKH